jgi:hypothetical protein
MPNGQFKICSAMQAFDYSHHGRYELAVSDVIISEMVEAEPEVTWLLYPEYETAVSSHAMFSCLGTGKQYFYQIL